MYLRLLTASMPNTSVHTYLGGTEGEVKKNSAKIASYSNLRHDQERKLCEWECEARMRHTSTQLVTQASTVDV